MYNSVRTSRPVMPIIFSCEWRSSVCRRVLLAGHRSCLWPTNYHGKIHSLQFQLSLKFLIKWLNTIWNWAYFAWLPLVCCSSAVWVRAFREMPSHCFHTLPASSHGWVKHSEFKSSINTGERICRENQPKVDSCSDPVIRPPEVSHSLNDCLKEQSWLLWLLSL